MNIHAFMDYCEQRGVTFRIESDVVMNMVRVTVEIQDQDEQRVYVYRAQGYILDDVLAAAVLGHQMDQPDDVHEITHEIPF